MTRPSLAELQARMQAAIKDGDDAALALIAAPPHNSREDRLATYRNAYRLRLAAILRDDFDAIHAFLGDAQFEALSAAYIEACPSSTPNARWFADRFPAFTAATAPWNTHPVIGDLAALQWALAGAFDAADGEAASLQDLAALPPERAMDMVLAFTPSVRLLTPGTNAAAILSALRQDETPPDAASLPNGCATLVWRADLQARYRPLEPEEAMLLAEAMAGRSFGLLCEMAAMMADPGSAAPRVAGYLRGWIESGMVAGIKAPAPAG